MTRQAIDIEEIRQRVANGENSRAIATEVGTTFATIYRLCDKEGIAIRGRNVPKNPVESIDTAIADMRPAEALEYVLEAFKQATGQDDDTLSLGMSLGLTAGEAGIFGILHGRMGTVVPTGRIVTLLDLTRPGSPDRDTEMLAKVQISRARRKLAGKFQIKTAWGVGYSMVPA